MSETRKTFIDSRHFTPSPGSELQATSGSLGAPGEVTSRSEAARRTPATAERVLDVAEEMFAERGYDASSLAEIAGRVGIRTPSLYNHFKSKRALYVAVLERNLDSFSALLAESVVEPLTPRQAEGLIEAAIRHHLSYPNLARLIQHAALAGGAQIELLLERWYDGILEQVGNVVSGNPALTAPDPARARVVIMAFHSMILGYVTLAPLHRKLLGADPLAPEPVERYVELVSELSRSLWRPQ
jgi:TetR/AcrR family transcriptional regulator